MVFASPETGVAPRRFVKIILVFYFAVAACGCGASRPVYKSVTPSSRHAFDTININLADSRTLESLPGIGKKTAGRIILYREEFGPFKNTAELMLVEGIGEKQFLKLRSLVRTE
ncbi:MAG: helix-hairpin-helix domain-containing protein [Pyrinomonadaceae bacterium]|nr:helix-hairpin-helix domain-containing protein [Pyrinomonadaceae bacterium]